MSLDPPPLTPVGTKPEPPRGGKRLRSGQLQMRGHTDEAPEKFDKLKQFSRLQSAAPAARRTRWPDPLRSSQRQATVSTKVSRQSAEFTPPEIVILVAEI